MLSLYSPINGEQEILPYKSICVLRDRYWNGQFCNIIKFEMDLLGGIAEK